MHPETQYFVNELRKEVKSVRSELDNARQRFGDNKDEYLHQEIEKAYVWLDDVDAMFLNALDKDRIPPRSLVEEAQILKLADHHYRNIARTLVDKIREWSVTLGPAFTAIAAQ